MQVIMDGDLFPGLARKDLSVGDLPLGIRVGYHQKKDRM